MELKKTQTLIGDMLELCNQLGDDSLSDSCFGIYNDLQAAKTIHDAMACGRELMVFISEAPWSDYDLDGVKDEIENIFARLTEEYEEF
jgi:hypothetical protein